MKETALIISCFDWYENRLEPIREILKKKYDVMVLLSDYNHIRKTVQEKRDVACTYLHVPSYHKNISIKRIFSHFCFGQAVRRQIQLLQPDLIYLVLPPNYTAFHCLRYFRKHPYVRYYIDLIDLWPESFPNKDFQRTIFAKLWRKLRNDSIRLADHVFVECDLYRQKLTHVIGNRERITVLRLFREQSPEEYLTVLKNIQNYTIKRGGGYKSLSIAYLGSINYIIDIKSICNTIKTLIEANYRIDVRIIGGGENKEEFIYRLRKCGAKVRYYGEIYDQFKKINLIGLCDYGFNMMKKDIAVGLTLKSIDYLSMGIPLLNNIPGDTWDLIEKENVGINVDQNHELFLKKINEGIDHKKCLDCFQYCFSKSAFIKAASVALKNYGKEISKD